MTLRPLLPLALALSACTAPDVDLGADCSGGKVCKPPLTCDPKTLTCQDQSSIGPDAGLAPDTRLDSTPGATSGPSASFSFSSTTAGASFQCAVDAAAFAACTSPDALSGLTAGTHTFKVRALAGGVADPSPATFTWTVDLGKLVVTITGGPAEGAISGPSPTFTYTASATAQSWSCGLDGAAASCPADGKSYSGLKGGAHTFAVTATDAGGTTSDPATVHFTVDADGPVVTVTAPAGTVGAAGAIAFTATDASPPLGFTCDLGAGAAACTSGAAYSGLAAGANQLVIVATDAWGNTSTTTQKFTVDTSVPAVAIAGIAEGDVVCGAAVVVGFDTVPHDDQATYTCALDGAAPVACHRPSIEYDDVPGGAHTVHVVATNGHGSAGPEAKVDFQVDGVKPTVTITTPAADTVTCAAGPIAYAVADAVASPGAAALASCTVAQVTDSVGPEVPCAAGPSYAGLSTIPGGHYRLSIAVKDACGNVSPTATRDFDVDTVPPEVIVTAPGRTPSSCPAGPITYTIADLAPVVGGQTTLVAASVDGSACTATGTVCRTDQGGTVGLGFVGLSDAANPHRVDLHVADVCGNVGQGGASFVVDSTGPMVTLGTPKAGALNSGAATVSVTVDETAKSVEGGILLGPVSDGDLVPSCTCTATSCACKQLAAGANTLAVRAVDGCDNPGPYATASAKAQFGPYDGHVVLIGEDYTGAGTPKGLVGNAAALTPWVHHKLGGGRQTVRVLAWRPTGVDAGAVAAVKTALRDTLAGYGVTFTATDPLQYAELSSDAQLGALLPGRDVLLLFDPGTGFTSDQLDATGTKWAAALAAFTDAGGVVVALDGNSGDLAGQTYRVLSGVLAVNGAVAVFADTGSPRFSSTMSLSYPAADLGTANYLLVKGVDDYPAPDGSACFDVADAQASVVVDAVAASCGDGCRYSICPAVIDKLRPAFTMTAAVTPDPAPPQPMECTVPVTGVTGGGGYAVAPAQGQPALPAGTFACDVGPDPGLAAVASAARGLHRRRRRVPLRRLGLGRVRRAGARRHHLPRERRAGAHGADAGQRRRDGVRVLRRAAADQRLHGRVPHLRVRAELRRPDLLGGAADLRELEGHHLQAPHRRRGRLTPGRAEDRRRVRRRRRRDQRLPERLLHDRLGRRDRGQRRGRHGRGRVHGHRLPRQPGLGRRGVDRDQPQPVRAVMRTVKIVVRTLCALAMMGVGFLHFVRPAPFVAIVPAALPAPLLLVHISGAAEIAGGLGLLWWRTRRAAGWGLIALYIAVFPANINMAVNHIQIGASPPSDLVLWGRLPFQLVFIALAYWFTRPDPEA